jgi:hypothetical protein
MKFFVILNLFINKVKYKIKFNLRFKFVFIKGKIKLFSNIKLSYN